MGRELRMVPPNYQHPKTMLSCGREDSTWYQLWETVRGGTPVTPAFATKEELVNYLVEHGDFCDQQRRKEGVKGVNCAPWTREEAESLVLGGGWPEEWLL